LDPSKKTQASIKLRLRFPHGGLLAGFWTVLHDTICTAVRLGAPHNNCGHDAQNLQNS